MVMKKYRDGVSLSGPRATMSGVASLKTESKPSPSVPPSSLRLRIRRKSTDTFIHGIDGRLLELITDVHSAEDSASFLLPSAAGLLRSPTAADIFVRSRIISSMFPAGGMRPRLLARLARIITRAARNATRRRKGGVVVTGTVFIRRKRDLMTEEEEEGMVARCVGCGCAIYSLKEYDEGMEDYGDPFCLHCMDQIDGEEEEEEGPLRCTIGGAPEEELHHCNCSPAMN